MARPNAEETITEEQAEQALRELTGKEPEQAEASAGPEPHTEAAPEAESTEIESAPEGTQETAEEPETDDVASLKRRAQEAEDRLAAAQKRSQEQMDAFRQRYQRSEGILRDKFLRKSTALDKARQVLQQTRSEDGVTAAEVEKVLRELEGTMNPQSASYAPPPSQNIVDEDQTVIMGNFLNDMGMTLQEEQDFGNWLKTEAANKMSPAELGIADESVAGFLRIAHRRWTDDSSRAEAKAKTDDAVAHVRAVQQTQRQAANAGSHAPSSPKSRLRSKDGEVDLDKLTPADISRLARESVEQYR